MRRLLLGLLLCSSALAQDASSTVSFHITQPGQPVQEWGMEVRGDGKGRYWEPVAKGENSVDGKRWREIVVMPATVERLREGLGSVAKGSCETRAKNIARTGVKELSFVAGEAKGACVFNYSDDKGVMNAAATFQAIAETIQMGQRLELKRRFDRLGLDESMAALAHEVQSGSAIELENIAPTLRKLANDGELLERVRVRAAAWLAEMPSGTP